MQSGVARTVTILVTIIILILVLLFSKALQKPQLSTEQLRHWNAFVYEQPRDLMPIELQDHHGKTFDNKNLQGKWSLIFFGFTSCPDVCPTTLATMATLADRLKDLDDIQYAMVSLDPVRDTQEKLAQYMPYFHPDFIGLRGEENTIKALALSMSVAVAKMPLTNNDYSIDHGGQIVLLNPQGQHHGFFKAPHRVADLEQAMRAIVSAYSR